MNDAMAVNLKTIPSENVTISYAYSLNEELDEQTTLTTNTKFECQVLPAKNDQIYIYVVISPNEGFSSVNFTQEIVWYMGMKGQVNIVNGTETITQTIVKGQELNEDVVEQPTIPEKYMLDGYYYDKEYKNKATFPLKTQGLSLYAKIVYDRSEVYSLNGTTDSEGYILYGAYPQDYVGNTLNTTLKNELANGTLEATSWEYTTDIDGVETTLQEYVYEDNLYVYLSSSKVVADPTFHTAMTTIIGNGNAYFFKVQPLCWTNNNGTYVCSSIMGSMRFDSSALLWENSEVRTYLNDVFYIESGINKVKTSKTIVQNNSISSVNDGSGASTEDYIWLPSYNEMYNWYASDSARVKYNTDFNDATYGKVQRDGGPGVYWVRSVSKYEMVYYITTGGSFTDGTDHKQTSYGIVPCFSLD